MPLLQGKRALLDLFVDEGIEIIFGNPGSTELALMDALAADDRIKYVLGLQEAAVMAMADGYGQATRKLCAVNLHAAPGLGNALGMLYNAKRSNVPILVTAGQQDSGFNLTEPLLWDDLATIARPFVKWSLEINSLAELSRAVHRAAKIALSPPAGPVFLSLPGNVLAETAEVELLGSTRIAPQIRGDMAAIVRAAELILASRSPIILAGDAVAQVNALDDVASLAELIGAPAYCEAMASTASFPSSHPFFAGTINRLPAAVRQALNDHDLIVSLGADLFTHSLVGNEEAVRKDMNIVHIDTDMWQLGKNYPTLVAIFADMRTALPELRAAIAERMTDEVRAEVDLRARAVRQKNVSRREALVERAMATAHLSPIKALSLLHAIGEALPDNAIVIEELLSSAEGVRLLLRSNDAHSFYGMRGGGIGWGLGAAIGVKLGQPDRPVVALLGDGSSLFTIQALWTAAHERLGVVFIIFNNRSYRILKQRTQAIQGDASRNGRYIGMDLDDPAIDFVALAQSLGVRAASAATIADTITMLKSGIADNVPLLINVEIDGVI